MGKLEDKARVGQILNAPANRRKDFVKRILEPKGQPMLTEAGTGKGMSHKMTWSGGHPDEPNIVYPTIIRDPKDPKKLKKLSDKAAHEHAVKTGEFISAPDSKAADWLSKRYKAVWEKE